MVQMTSAGGDVFRNRGFVLFWSAETVSGFGTYITTIALQVLVVLTLGGTATDVGLLNASRWLPYLLLGLIVGALVDRRRRRPILIGTDLGRGILLGLIPLFWVLGWLTLPLLLLFVACFGVLSLLNDASSMSFLPRLMPRQSLLAANARLEQSSAVTQTSGPVVAGALVTALGAPLAVLVDAATYFYSAIAVSRIAIDEPPAVGKDVPLHLRRNIADGLRWVYRHRTLGPMAVFGHVWFLFNSMLITVFVPFVLLQLGLTAFELGLALAGAGITGLIGSTLSTRFGMRFGAGPAIIACFALMPLGWVLIALVPSGTLWITVAVLAAGQGIYGLCLGLQNANEMGYRQAVTPDALQSRTNTTIRSVNRAMIVIGAPVGGILADSIGYRPTFWIGIGGFVVVAVGLALSPFRHARHDEEPPAG
jgi:MFS family permease